MSEKDAGLAAALGRIPSGLFVVTIRKGTAETAMLASWVQQCAFDPPHLSVVVKQGRAIHSWLKPESTFVLNIVGEGHKRLISHFGRGFEPDEPAFHGIETTHSQHGHPVLTHALGFLECEVTDRMKVGDHELVVARVLAGAMQQDGEPMIHVRKNGLRY